jgi:hypothetical protein
MGIFYIYINELAIFITIYPAIAALDRGVITAVALGCVRFWLGAIQPAGDAPAQRPYHHHQGGNIGNHSRKNEQQTRQTHGHIVK